MKNLILPTSFGIFLFLGIISCSNNANQNRSGAQSSQQSDTSTIFTSIIEPPIAGINVPYIKQSFLAEEGANFTFASGASINFPSNSLVDEKGAMVRGAVEVSMREFRDPFDFYIAGIPMTYEENGTQYNFESTAMFEIEVEQGSQAVFVNPENKPQISLGKRTNLNDKLYYLDTLKEKWVSIEEGIEEETPKDSSVMTSFALGGLSKPVKPKEPNTDRPSFTVAIPYIQKFPELKIFGDTKFEIDESEKNYDPAEADLEWDRVEIEESSTMGIYIVKFFRPKREIAYRVRPVYEGEDFDSAMSIYSDKMNDYNRLLAKREQERAEREKAAQVLSLFEINQFGIWNCDRFIASPLFSLKADFVDQKNEPLDLNLIYLASENINGVVSYPPSQISLLSNSPHVLWGISRDKFVYFTYRDFEKSGINEQSRSHTFKMRTYQGELDDYNDLKKVLGVF